MKDPMIKALQDEALYTPENVLFLLGVQNRHLHPDMMDYLETLGDAEILARKFLEFDNGWQLKPMFYEKREKDEYREFAMLLKEIGIGTNGYENNPLGYSIGIGSQDSQDAFKALKRNIPDLDLIKLAQCIKAYYAENRYATKLSKYLREEAYFAYHSDS